MSPSFELEIRLANSAMRTPADVAAALRKVAERLEVGGVSDAGAIRDENGNTCGHFVADFPAITEED